MTRHQKPLVDTVALDSEGLSLLINRDRHLLSLLDRVKDDNPSVITSAATLVEAVHPRMNRGAVQWALSQVTVVPVTQEIAESATELLREAGLHGHQHALDAIVGATATQRAGETMLLTSDPKDMRALVGGRVGIVPV